MHDSNLIQGRQDCRLQKQGRRDCLSFMRLNYVGEEETMMTADRQETYRWWVEQLSGRLDFGRGWKFDTGTSRESVVEVLRPFRKEGESSSNSDRFDVVQVKIRNVLLRCRFSGIQICWTFTVLLLFFLIFWLFVYFCVIFWHFSFRPQVIPGPPKFFMWLSILQSDT